MTVELGIIISLIGCIIGIVSFIIGQKKAGKDDGMELGTFIRRNKNRNSQYKIYDNGIKKRPQRSRRKN